MQVSVPQCELLSLISAAKSLGIRGLAETDGAGEQAEQGTGGDTCAVSTSAMMVVVAVKDLQRKESVPSSRGLKRETEESSGLGSESEAGGGAKKMRQHQPFPKLQHKLASKLWSQPETVNR